MIAGAKVWITGAGSGIGLALTREFLKANARVLAIDRDEQALDKLKKEADLTSLPLEILAADVGDGPAFLKALAAAAAQYGAPDVFVNNAGIARVGAFAELELQVFESVLRVNLMGVVYGSSFALSHMQKAERGLIINMASMAGHLPSPFMTSYAASKAAVVGFTRSLQAELRLSQSPVRVCLVCPGFIDTPIMQQRGVEFPRWLRWLVKAPAPTASEIIRQALAGYQEIYPDFSGRLMGRLYRLAPGLATRASRLLLAQNWAERLGGRINISPRGS